MNEISNIFRVVFLRPKGIIGYIITFFTKDDFYHSAVIIGDEVWSSEIPVVKKHQYNDYIKDDRHCCLEIGIDMTPDKIEIIKSWLNSRVGKMYDLYALIGWFFNIPKLQWRNRFYCHEFCREPLEKVNMLNDVGIKKLVTASTLIREMYALDGFNIRSDCNGMQKRTHC